MRAVDTNVIVRLVTQDDAEQMAAAEDFIAMGAWVSHITLVEAMWVLKTGYERSPEQIASTIEMLFKHEHLTVQDSHVVMAALAEFRRRPALGFSDCLVLEVARKAGHLPLGTFDRNLGKLEGAERL